jgi:glycosyltransferase involved in cell wall biosynthesis
MRILHLDTGRQMRGGQWQVLRLLNGLAAAKVDNILLAPGGSPLFEKAASAGIDAQPVTPMNLLARADLVHAHDARAHTLAAVAGRRPLVVSRRVAFPIHPGRLHRWKYSRAAQYVAVSDFVKQVMEAASVPGDRISVIYDGVPQLPASAGGDRILAPQHSDDKPASLYPPGVHFAAELEKELHTAALFLYLTRCEGLGSGILLAMSAGVPVIASKVGGIPEIIRHEWNGLLVDNTPESVAAAIRSLREDPEFARLLAGRARRTIEEKFSLDMMVQKTLALYQQVLG